MTLYCYPMDFTGCGSYRCTFVVDALPSDVRAKVRVVPPGSDDPLIYADVVNDVVKDVVAPDDCTGVLLQRPSNHTLVACIPYLQRQGIPVIVDVDDDLGALNPRHPVWYALHPRPGVGAPDQDWHEVEQACRTATLVTVSTPALLEKYAAHGRGALLRNCVPERYFEPGIDDTPAATADEVPEGAKPAGRPDSSQAVVPHIGWAGGIFGHPDDLRPLGAAMAEVCRRQAVGFRVVGPPPPDWALGLPAYDVRRLVGVAPSEFVGSIPFPYWMAHVRTIHTGIAPLNWERFNLAKSWLKPLEYAAAGVPFVATETPEYLRLGAGLLARKPREWKACLTRLLIDPLLRSEEVERNASIARQHTYERHAMRWVEAWDSVGALG
jgi:glycosyltransferase involved in cell wall biosynthesis